MSLPPQPGPWDPGNPPPPGPPQGYQQHPGYYPQTVWGPQPPKQNNGLKWLLIAVAVLLVIAITVGVTLFFTRGSGGGGSTTPAASDIASANDTGPVAIITSDPTCTVGVQFRTRWPRRSRTVGVSATVDPCVGVDSQIKEHSTRPSAPGCALPPTKRGAGEADAPSRNA